MSGSELGAIFRLEFYKKQYKWASQPSHRSLQRERLEADTSTSLRLRRSRPGSAHSNSSQLNTTYSIEELENSNSAGAEDLPQPQFIDDFVDSWVHAASSCSAHDTDADGLYALEPEPEFCAGAAGAPHSSELNLYRPSTPAPAPAPAPETPLQLDTCTPYNISAVESDKDCMLTIPMECDVSRPPPPLTDPRPAPAPAPAPDRPSPLCVSDLKWNTYQEWTAEELVAAADVELRAAAAHAHRHRTLVALCHRLAPHKYLPPSAVVCCPLCGARTDGRCIDAPAPPPPSRGRGHLPRMAPPVPLALGQWARVQSVAMVTRYP